MNIIPERFFGFLQAHVPAIARKLGDVFHINHGDCIRQSMRNIQDPFKEQGLDILECFAIKTNPRQAIGEITLSEGGGFDCGSSDELKFARELKTPPDHIILTSINTPPELYVEAVAHGGCILNLDDESFVNKVPDPFPKRIFFRLNPGDRKTGDEVNSIIGEPRRAKFGVPIENIERASQAAIDRGAESIGLHLMVCSNDRNYLHVVNTIKLGLEKISDIEAYTGVPVHGLDFGGGMGIPYRPGDERFDFQALAKEVRPLMSEFLRLHGYFPKLYMESGRYVTGPNGVLINRVINVFTKYRKYVGVRCAITGVPRYAQYKAYHHHMVLRPDGSIKGGPTEIVSICGPTCENNDYTAVDIELPVVEEGDFIVTFCGGGHCAASAGRYGWQAVPPELLVQDGVVRVINRAPTYADNTALQRGLEGSKYILKL